MKKIVVIFLILAAAFSFIISYNQIDKEELKKVEKAEEEIAKQFVIPNELMLADPDELYPILYEAANECKVNIFRTNIHYNTDDKVEISKYILLTNDTRFWDAFRIENDRVLNAKNTQEDNFFISTAKGMDATNQIGIIKDFGNNNLITIKPLKNSYEYLPIYGQYFIEASDDDAFNAFIQGFTDKVNKQYKRYRASFTPEDFKNNVSDTENYSTSSINILKYIYYMIFIITLILLIYYIFNESKRIGIMKMHGISNMRLWLIIVGWLVTVIFILSIIISLPLALAVKNTTCQFVYAAVVDQFKTYIIMTAFSLVSFIYIRKIKVSQVIKNRKETKGIFVLNMFLKIGCSIALVFIGFSIWNQYAKVCNKQENLKNWYYNKDYGIFYPVKIGYDQEDIKHNLPIFTLSVNRDLYAILNKMGAILINARSYEEEALLLDKNYDGIRSISVNNNYLREFPVYDVHNKPIQISEETSDWILLVPEKYHHKEKEILSYFEKDRKDSIAYEKEFIKKEAPNYVKNQQIKIIWIENDQKIFSFNPEVFKAENNVIIDPIIQVITEKNSVIADRSSILGGGFTDPLKIKLMNRDVALTYKILESELKRLRLDDNLKHLISADQFIFQEIYGLQKQMYELLLISLGLVLGLLILVTQNLIIFFDKNMKKFIIRRVFGTGFFKTYKEYILLFLATWISQILVCYALNRASNSKLLAVAAMLILIELIASVIALTIIERRNKVKVLKGGI